MTPPNATKYTPPPGSALALLTIPYVFTQDALLTTEQFIRRAKDLGHRITADTLQTLHEHGLLIPLYMVCDEANEARRLDVQVDWVANARGWVLQAAVEGRLRATAEDGPLPIEPYRRPADIAPEADWWNGYVYSSWQLLQLDHALKEYAFIQHGWTPPPTPPPRRARHHKTTLALAALSTRYLPGVLGRISFPMGTNETELRRYRANSDAAELLRIADIAPEELADIADKLLLDTHDDPLAKWVPLIRHASYRGWSKLRGEPLASMWRRVAAEILLRTHEDLAASNVLEPLRDLSGINWHSPQHDRLTPRFREAESLERALADFGLSPYPKVLLLVEGETELYHAPRLLSELGVGAPQDVRVQHTKGSKVDPHLIARYGVTPRVGRKLGDSWLLDASATALVIAMDAENNFATEEKRSRLRRSLQDAIREGVLYQDADIGQEELDILVSIHVWGEDSYELANFTDDELVPALTTLANTQGSHLVQSATWESELRAELADARQAHRDIKVAMGRMRIKEQKVLLAKLLWPNLLTKCEAEYSADNVETPILRILLEVRRIIGQVSGASALKIPEQARPQAQNM
ncbi:hypothetical protein [Micromonospora chalcea]|uniref:hypothetical protein n=1 Tax=Micromonospora chalcea TaxID=1874 RepID=UPI0034569293